jgi:dolichol kinase
MCVSAALCAALFAEPVAAAALVMVMVGDGAAAVVGRRYGRHRYPFGAAAKSLEGSAALFLTALAATLPLVLLGPPYAPLAPLQLGLGALAATVVEALPVPVNDNVRVPLAAGLAMTLA